MTRERIYLPHAAVSASQHNQTVEMSFTEDIVDQGAARKEWLMHPEDAISLATNLITAARSALRSQIVAALAGECEDCGNSRFVDKAKPSGRTEKVHCPTCWPRATQVPPNMANWAEDETPVLARR